MNDDAWLHPYGRMPYPPHRARDGLRVAGDRRPRAFPRRIFTGACLAVIMAMMSLPGTTWAQPGVDDMFAIPVHPAMPTIVRLPDEITRARVNPGKAMRVTLIGRTLHVRPQSDVPAGLEAMLEVETVTMLLTFRLHVVERAMDAREELVVVAMKSEQRAEDGPVGAEHAARIDAGASRRGPGHAPALAPPRAEPPAGPEPAMDIEHEAPPELARPVPDAGPGQLEISVHAVAGPPGVTSLQIRGYESQDARQYHLVSGIRVSAARPDTWWAIEAGITGELPLAAMVYGTKTPEGSNAVLELSGPWLHMDLSLRAHFGARWRPTIHAGIGLQAHFRDVNVFRQALSDPDRWILDYSRHEMPFGGVLVFGTGFEHRRGDMLLGIELQVRQGVPAGYHSVDMLLSVGYFLDQGE